MEGKKKTASEENMDVNLVQSDKAFQMIYKKWNAVNIFVWISNTEHWTWQWIKWQCDQMKGEETTELIILAQSLHCLSVFICVLHSVHACLEL